MQFLPQTLRELPLQKMRVLEHEVQQRLYQFENFRGTGLWAALCKKVGC